jgi:hypothetical protein
VHRNELAAILMAQPFDTDVQVNVSGFLIDVTHAVFDHRRHAIILELFPEDAEQAMRHYFRAGPLQRGTGNSL